MASCMICNDDQRLEIDRRICRGENLAGLSREYDLSYDCLQRHAKAHISYQLETAIAKQQDAQGSRLLGEIDDLIQRSKDLLDRADSQGKLDTALRGIGQLRGVYELLSKISFAAHSARIEEQRLQLERDQMQLSTAFWQAADTVLTEGERGVLKLLHEKVDRRDVSRDVLAEAGDKGLGAVYRIQFVPGDEADLSDEAQEAMGVPDGSDARDAHARAGAHYARVHGASAGSDDADEGTDEHELPPLTPRTRERAGEGPVMTRNRYPDGRRPARSVR